MMYQYDAFENKRIQKNYTRFIIHYYYLFLAVTVSKTTALFLVRHSSLFIKIMYVIIFYFVI